MTGSDRPGIPGERQIADAIGIKYRPGSHADIVNAKKWKKDHLALGFLKERLLEAVEQTGDLRKLSPTGHLINKQQRFKQVTSGHDVFFVKLKGNLSIVTATEINSHVTISQNRAVTVKVIAVVKTEYLKSIQQS